LGAGQVFFSGYGVPTFAKLTSAWSNPHIVNCQNAGEIIYNQFGLRPSEHIGIDTSGINVTPAIISSPSFLLMPALTFGHDMTC
jgi:hypothetical protein